jgi:hypothetical protein
MAMKKPTTSAKAKSKVIKTNEIHLRKPGRKPYPVMTFEEVMPLARGIMEDGAGHPVRRLTLLKRMRLEPNANATRNLITNSGKYGLTQGAHDSEELRLTDLGRIAVASESSPRRRTQAFFDLAIKSQPYFMKLYECFKGNKLPVREVMRDLLDDLHEGDRSQCVDIFIGNANAVGLLRVKSGAEHLQTIEQLLDTTPAQEISEENKEIAKDHAQVTSGTGTGAEEVAVEEDFEKICFFMAPIGNEGDEKRKHSDMILASYVEPAVEGHGLRVVRADRITKPGMISAQIMEYILKSKLVIVDMSYHNPNVFYELCLRHVTGGPIVHIIREEDYIPFDVGNFRTIRINTADKFELVARLESHRAEIANHVRQVLSDGASLDNPILTYCPSARVVLRSNGDSSERGGATGDGARVS